MKPADNKPWFQQAAEYVISVIAYLLIVFIVYSLFMGTTLPWLHSLFMIKTDGVVLSTNITSSRVSGQSGGIPYTSDPQFSPKIEFSYVVEGEKLTSSRFSLSGTTFDTLEARKIASRYMVGQTIPIWYSALDNHYAVIEPQPSYLKSLFGFLLLVVICLYIWKIVFIERSGQYPH